MGGEIPRLLGSILGSTTPPRRAALLPAGFWVVDSATLLADPQIAPLRLGDQDIHLPRAEEEAQHDEPKCKAGDLVKRPRRHDVHSAGARHVRAPSAWRCQRCRGRRRCGAPAERWPTSCFAVSSACAAPACHRRRHSRRRGASPHARCGCQQSQGGRHSCSPHHAACSRSQHGGRSAGRRARQHGGDDGGGGMAGNTAHGRRHYVAASRRLVSGLLSRRSLGTRLLTLDTTAEA
mmetsp:Transcript_24617/g.72913  ORF Transcript_24617/g.72913 Transcript_24617/m.72913 type:complete len:235 (-) Transcript_24617:238-942(-)